MCVILPRGDGSTCTKGRGKLTGPWPNETFRNSYRTAIHCCDIMGGNCSTSEGELKGQRYVLC